ncbi:uncharacterized protein LOC124811573 [Hydra vulgaris]|uniref:uncharacterized protein LOC124811573 n=1 Tax=Hydra vulgaris TaxID=6087 RepID=UPI001F5E7998|nr:uncharacterized protein LOC124811573 isoform X2 [Hydra vulgaris]
MEDEIETDISNRITLCVKCGEDVRMHDPLNHVGSKYSDSSKKKHPLTAIIEHAMKLNLDTFVDKLKLNKRTKANTYIHLSCRSFLKNRSRKRSMKFETERIARAKMELFDFKTQCFYCGGDCVYDRKNPNRNKFEEVRTKKAAIYSSTIEICRNREDQLAKTIEARLISVNDLVAAEGRYHVSCRASFENPLLKYLTSGRPTCSNKMTSFNTICELLERDIELYTLSEFHLKMMSISDDVYSIKMKLKEVYGKSLRFVKREGRSNIILLDSVRDILCEKWYQE